ncbi:hypothetical protein PoB_001191100 [Plakobranchus ocellatus]|uniref:Secreted protein n=1 Tax=Plakobranchus ocellatus TaxID=259542 RepID=A0AAV3YSN0_9GAST|nr:hypothetical protein PoB_001191100 [Plakobranchus ocellatus]
MKNRTAAPAPTLVSITATATAIPTSALARVSVRAVVPSHVMASVLSLANTRTAATAAATSAPVMITSLTPPLKLSIFDRSAFPCIHRVDGSLTGSGICRMRVPYSWSDSGRISQMSWRPAPPGAVNLVARALAR